MPNRYAMSTTNLISCGMCKARRKQIIVCNSLLSGLKHSNAPNADIERYTQLLANAREVAVGDTNPAIQQLERSLARSQATITSLNREIETATKRLPRLSCTGRNDSRGYRQCQPCYCEAQDRIRRRARCSELLSSPYRQ